MGRPRVVIVGGGFGGLACARALDGRPAGVVLLDERNFHLFTPLLYQVATALLNPSDIAFPLRARFRLSKNVRFRQARVDLVDIAEKKVRTSSGDQIGFDYVVLATGSSTNFFGDEHLGSFTIGLRTLEEGLRLRNHVLSCLERATQEPDQAERERWLTFVIVGGGPTGVEYAGALVELFAMVLGRDYPSLTPDSVKVLLVEGRDRLLGEFHPGLSRYAERILTRRGVEVRTGVLVDKATPEGVTLSTGEDIQAQTIVWSAGVVPNVPEIRPLPPLARSHRIEVDDRMRVRGTDAVFAIGDIAAARSPNGDELPMLSPVAIQAGRYVADQILHGGSSPRSFRYVDKGTMATIGRNAAVGQIKGLRLTGFVGWLGWLVVHIYYLIGFRNRLVVLGSWAWDYLRRDRPIRIVVRSEDDPIANQGSSGGE